MTKEEIQKCCMISDHILNEYEEIIRRVAKRQENLQKVQRDIM